ncbi:cilia- and flagella-associated protein 57-like [Conger conger]|uniref:cilia- and flagella-associated protein 57-like n=1 Tax=Conger conger TaxID=82655 RepID=UPI002A5AAFD7|nr:cilia- and flagella-associated protein 57-like [Conger conger]
MRQQIMDLEAEKEELVSEHDKTLKAVREEHTQVVEDLNLSMHGKLRQEYEASHLLQQELEECRQQLQSAETGHKRAIEQLTNSYEEEHRFQLQQCKDKAQWQKMEYELILKTMAEEIFALRCKYKAKSKTMRDMSAQYKDEARIMKKRFECLGEIKSKRIEKLEAEVKKNLNIISNLENDVLGLKQQIMLRNENIQEKNSIMMELKEKMQTLQTEKLVLQLRDMQHDCNVKEMKEEFTQETKAMRQQIMDLEAEKEELVSEHDKTLEAVGQMVEDLNSTMHEKLWQGNVASHLLQEELEEYRQQLQGAETGHKREIEQLTSSYESRLEQLTSSYEFRLEEHRHQLQQISEMRERNTDLQSMKFILDNRVKELTTQIKELKMEEELIQSSAQKSRQERSITDLKLKLNAKDKDMRKKMERACDTSTVVKRFKADLLSCVGFIQDPKRLKESVLQMHARYIRQSDEDLLRQDLGKLRDGREEVDVARNMVKSLQRKLSKETEFHSTQRFKLIQENSTLIKELNDFKRALKDSQDKVHDYENQLSVYRRKKPSNSSGTKGPGSTSSPRTPHSLATNLTRKEVAQRLIPWQRA